MVAPAPRAYVGAMTAGARTPEELDTLLEDAFVMRDARSPTRSSTTARCWRRPAACEARGDEAIGHALAELWAGGRTYVARPRRVLQARDTALVVAAAGIHVLRRGGDGTWRAAISLLDLRTTRRRTT